MESIKDAVLSSVEAEDVWKNYFPEWEEGKNVNCPFHDDEKPSLSLSLAGKGYCHGCSWRCTSVVGFVIDHDKVTFKKALKRIRYRYVGDIVPAREWTEWQKLLMKNDDVRLLLERDRGITSAIIKRFRLGWYKNRLTIPIMDEMNCCVNVRMHDALRRHKGKIKMVSYKKKMGKARLFPLDALSAKHAKIYLFEGELNTILASRLGLNAVCVTSGARVWKDEFTERFAGRKVVVCQDVNDPDNAGTDGAKKKCEAISKVALWVKNLKLPIEDRGGDLIDYVVKHGHDLNDFLELEKATPYYKNRNGKRRPEKSDRMDYEGAKETTLKEAAHTENFGKPIKVRCLVASVDLAPYVPPKKVRVTCKEHAQHQAAGQIPPKCGACWLPEVGLEKEVVLRPEQRELIAILDKNDVRVDHGVRRMTKVPMACRVDFDVIDVHNIHAIGIIPDVPKDRSTDVRHDYVLRTGYYFGKNMEANKGYEFDGFSMSHPDTQQVTHVFVSAKSTLSAVDRFKLDEEQVEQLDELFGADGDAYGKLMSIYSDFSVRITKIVQRPLLHAAVDLVWHSPLHFNFNGEYVHKGWLEAAIFGDTRCGKGFVAEGLARHYGLGEVVSGENCSIAGLVGGLETMGRRLVLRWGAVPLNDGGLVIVDEMGDMAQEIFSKLSRIRSEGIAELTKIGHHQKTLARTRLLWLCNPREGVMSDYTYGVQALQGIVGKAEDIARFDYAFAVADGEVRSAAINSVRQEPRPSKYKPDLCRQLIYWVWSRKAKQIRFTDRAVKEILTVHAKDLSGKYSPSIPLIQGQNIRVKLAKVSCAVAARVFSHPKGKPSILKVDSDCVDAAARLLDEFYKKPSMAYDSFSRKAMAETSMGDERELEKLFGSTLKPKNSLALVRCLLSRRISVRALAAASTMDKMEAEQTIVDVLLRANAIAERSNGYFHLRPPFKMWLERKERDLETRGQQ